MKQEPGKRIVDKGIKFLQQLKKPQLLRYMGYLAGFFIWLALIQFSPPKAANVVAVAGLFFGFHVYCHWARDPEGTPSRPSFLDMTQAKIRLRPLRIPAGMNKYVLLRSSEEPLQAQETILLRAATQGRETPPEQLLRATTERQETREREQRRSENTEEK